MKAYKVGLYQDDKIVAVTWKRGNNAEEVISKINWHMICQYPNVKYNRTEILEESD